MPEQLPLRYNDRWQDEQVWRELLEDIRVAVAHVRPKEVCHDLDIQPSVLSKALAEQDDRRVAVEWLVYLIRRAPNDRIVEVLAAIRGLEVHRPEPLTDAQKVARYEAALAKMPEALRRGFIEEAFGPGVKP